MQLSIEGERLLKAGDYNGAIEFFEASSPARKKERKTERERKQIRRTERKEGRRQYPTTSCHCFVDML